MILGPVSLLSPQMAFRRKDGHMVPPTVPGNSEKVPASNSETTILFADDNGPIQKPFAALLDLWSDPRNGAPVHSSRD